jgi:MoxR-like ATPase
MFHDPRAGASRRADGPSHHVVIGVSRAIIARDDEVRVIGSMLDDEVEQPRAVLIQGEPGIGKTTLFDGLLEMAGSMT